MSSNLGILEKMENYMKDGSYYDTNKNCFLEVRFYV